MPPTSPSATSTAGSSRRELITTYTTAAGGRHSGFTFPLDAVVCAVDGGGAAARKFFNLSERYERWRDHRVDPRGFGLHGVALAPGEVVRLTQDEVEAHPTWGAFGSQADKHPPLRGWLATPVCSEDARSYGLLQLSDVAGLPRSGPFSLL